MEASIDFVEYVLDEVLTELVNGPPSPSRLEEMLDVIKRSLDYMLLLESETDSASPVVAALLELVQLMDSMIEEEEIQQRGRPRIVIREDQLCFLLENGFRINDIASMFLCSGRTVERRMAELSMRASDFSDIADTDLDQLVERIILVHPQSGEKTVSSQLRSQGYKIQRQRIRDSIRRIDPIGVQLRSRRRLHRRVYQVASPNSLWHLDGYHKLIRWKLVVHGGIDGFSRLIMFLKVSTNNYASTVLSAFVSAVDEFGLPSRIRIDRGGENYLVSQFMLEHIGRGPNRHSVIAGRSVHNQRIERLWRDLYSGCICFFYTFFHFLEDILLLDPDNLLDIYALHFVFLPIIQGQLDTFREGWAHHSLRTERNKTPMQLWILGLSHMHSQNPESAEVNSMDGGDMDFYGTDWGGPVPVSDDDGTVALDDLPPLLSATQQQHLSEQLPTSGSLTEDWMISAYTIAKAFVHQSCS